MSLFSPKLSLSLFLVSYLYLGTASATAQTVSKPPLMQLSTQSSMQLVGLPIHWSNSDAVLLEPTGRLFHLQQSEIAAHKVLQLGFEPQSTIEAGRMLQQELGGNFEVLIQGPYVVAAPRNRAARWRDRFKTLLAGYVRYFEVRGWPLRQPDFPLVVIVLPDRISFQRFAAREADPMSGNVVGSYFPRSNRCILYELDSGGNIDWSETEATIVHEAIHQLAFNTGVHERLAENPLWLVEGFATMFEQPAVYDSRVNQANIESRMLGSKVQQIQPILREPGALETRLRSLIESDSLFEKEPIPAYTVAWAMAFYLTERMPNEFAAFLKMQRKRGFNDYSASSRSSDFRKAFQMDPTALALQMRRLFAK